MSSDNCYAVKQRKKDYGQYNSYVIFDQSYIVSPVTDILKFHINKAPKNHGFDKCG